MELISCFLEITLVGIKCKSQLRDNEKLDLVMFSKYDNNKKLFFVIPY